MNNVNAEPIINDIDFNDLNVLDEQQMLDDLDLLDDEDEQLKPQ